MPPEMLAAEEVSVSADGAVLLPTISLSIEPGESVAVLGPNGAGKTTLLRLLAGRIRPGSGRVTLRGAALDERRSEVRREIAALIEPPALYPDLVLAEQLALIEAAWASETRGSAGAGLVAGLGSAALDAFGLEPLRDRFPHELSSGQRQLASLAVVFARPANLLLLDEPEQRLDPDRRALLASAMGDARTRGASVVFASHDAELVERVADRRIRVGP